MELNELIIADDKIEKMFNHEIKDFLDKRVIDGYTSRKIHYNLYKTDNAKALIVISHGFTEYIQKYNEFIYYLINLGYSVLIAEHRGHGKSLRETDNYSSVYVKSFDYYVDDFFNLYNEVGKDLKLTPYLFGHSMGGCIASLFCQKYPEVFSKIIFNAPMFKIKTPSYALAAIVSGGALLLGKGKKKLITSSDDFGNFESSCSCCKPRYNACCEIRGSEKYYENKNASYKWAYNALFASIKATKEELKGKVLLLEADIDNSIDKAGFDAFEKHNKNMKRIKFPHSKHEIFLSNKDILIDYISTIDSFYSS